MMRNHRWILLALLIGAIWDRNVAQQPLSWPSFHREQKPWVYWWWMGSAVDEDNITRQLRQYQQAGMGGVHIIPIYGVRGEEKRFVPFLSARWLALLAHTVQEAEKLGLGVDMTSGTGWPFGGPWVTQQDASKQWRVEKFSSLTKVYNSGSRMVAVDSTTGVYYTLLEKPSAMKVKRAAPGGEGWVIDYLSAEGVHHYLAHFDSAFKNYAGPMPRAFYHDSFEATGCNGSDDFLSEFQRRRGYDLQFKLHALYGEGDQEECQRVLCDYRETQSDLLLERFTIPWVNWAHSFKTITRNQAHGSPGHLLDLYAVADIPETEAFGSSMLPIPGLRIDTTVYRQFGMPDLIVNKFASSAGHVAGRRLISSESCTWLAEHFQVSLSQVKPEIDRLFISGINHIFFHGMTYSPAAAGFPGWIFYASTQFDAFNPFWRDLPELTHYISRCQTFLQQGEADPDILLYFPVHDIWSENRTADGQLRMSMHNVPEWLGKSEFYTTASWLQQQGFSTDYISDRQLQSMVWKKGGLATPGCRAKALVIPGCRTMPVATYKKISALMKAGAAVVFCDGLPQDVPGWGRLEQRRQEIRKPYGEIAALRKNTDITNALQEWHIAPEALAARGLSFIRRCSGKEYLYFIANLGRVSVRQWIPLTVAFSSALSYDPLTGRINAAATRNHQQVYLHLEPGQTCILRISPQKITAPAAHVLQEMAEPMVLTGPWQARFISGEPRVQPDTLTIRELTSWTQWPLAGQEAFSGQVRYQTHFLKPKAMAQKWLLNLGQVCESARVSVNGVYVATCWSLPFTCEIEDRLLHPGENQLVVEVANLAANRVADLDRRGVIWKKFYDINMVGTDYRPLDASHWSAMPSGLLGPVRLTALGE